MGLRRASGRRLRACRRVEGVGPAGWSLPHLPIQHRQCTPTEAVDPAALQEPPATTWPEPVLRVRPERSPAQPAGVPALALTALPLPSPDLWPTDVSLLDPGAEGTWLRLDGQRYTANYGTLHGTGASRGVVVAGCLHEIRFELQGSGALVVDLATCGF